MQTPGWAQVVEWSEAVAAVERAAAARRIAGVPGVVIGITGPVGAGKSTLARLLSACVVTTDDYLPDYETVEHHERDLPERADLAGLAAALGELRKGQVARVPVWSFHTHRRESVREVEPRGMIVCEGIHALHETVLPVIDVRVFVEAPVGVRWGRWERMARDGERGWGVQAAREFFERVAEPTFGRYAGVYRGRADVVVVNGG